MAKLRRRSGRKISRTTAKARSPMNSSEILNLVRRYFAAYKSADRNAIERLLTDDFTFTSPYDDHIDRATYFQRCWLGAGAFEYHDLKHIFVKRNECFVLYESAAKDGSLFRNTEFFRFAGGQIQLVEVFFGLPPKRKESTHTGGSSPVNGRNVRGAGKR